MMTTTMKKKKGEMGMMGTKGGECGMCGREERWLLHNISYRSAYKRACTNCVLKNHPGSFCPICFHVYSHHHTLNPNPNPNNNNLNPNNPNSNNNNNNLLLVSCLKCASQAHSSCAPPSPSFLCPSCASPSPAPFFPPAPRSLDKLSSRALLAASSIAASSMSRAALAARAQADKSVREAVAAKKRARDALDKLAVLLATADSNTGASDN